MLPNPLGHTSQGKTIFSFRPHSYVPGFCVRCQPTGTETTGDHDQVEMSACLGRQEAHSQVVLG